MNWQKLKKKSSPNICSISTTIYIASSKLINNVFALGIFFYFPIAIVMKWQFSIINFDWFKNGYILTLDLFRVLISTINILFVNSNHQDTPKLFSIFKPNLFWRNFFRKQQSSLATFTKINRQRIFDLVFHISQLLDMPLYIYKAINPSIYLYSSVVTLFMAKNNVGISLRNID